MAGHVGVSRDVRGDHRRVGRHRLQQDDAERLTVQGRCAEHVGPAEPGDLVGLADRAEPLETGVTGVAGPEDGGVRPLPHDPHPHVGAEPGDRLQQDGEPLAFLVPPHEQDRRRLGRMGRTVLVAPQLHAVEGQVVTSPEVVLGQLAGVLRHRHPVVEPTGQEADRVGHEFVRQGTTGGVEGADQWCRPQEQRGHGRTGGEGLVQVDDVEVLVPHGPDGPQLSRRVGGDRGDRAVRRGRQAQAQRRHPRVRGWAVARRQHPHRVPLPAERPRQAEHLHLHAARQGEAVRADDADAHQPRSRRCSGTGRPSAS